MDHKQIHGSLTPDNETKRAQKQARKLLKANTQKKISSMDAALPEIGYNLRGYEAKDFTQLS